MTLGHFVMAAAFYFASCVGVAWIGVRRERRAFAAAFGEEPEESDDEPELDPAAVLAPYSPGDLVWVARLEDNAKRVPRQVVDVLPDGLIITGNPTAVTETDPNCFFYGVEFVAERVRPRKSL